MFVAAFAVFATTLALARFFTLRYQDPASCRCYLESLFAFEIDAICGKLFPVETPLERLTPKGVYILYSTGFDEYPPFTLVLFMKESD
jgi:hypothetical protein